MYHLYGNYACGPRLNFQVQRYEKNLRYAIVVRQKICFSANFFSRSEKSLGRQHIFHHLHRVFVLLLDVPIQDRKYTDHGHGDVVILSSCQIVIFVYGVEKSATTYNI